MGGIQIVVGWWVLVARHGWGLDRHGWVQIVVGGVQITMGGFRSLSVAVGQLVLVGGRGFALRGLLRVLGLVVVAKNGSVVGHFFIYFFNFWVCGYGFGSGGR